jgi:hypothetical protein
MWMWWGGSAFPCRRARDTCIDRGGWRCSAAVSALHVKIIQSPAGQQPQPSWSWTGLLFFAFLPALPELRFFFVFFLGSNQSCLSVALALHACSLRFPANNSRWPAKTIQIRS